jgi:hypothetical protein
VCSKEVKESYPGGISKKIYRGGGLDK